MRKDGQITVFLSLVLVCVLSLLCGLLESARTAGARYYLQMSMNSSLQSVFGQYNRALWEQYRILGLWCGAEGILEDELSRYLVPYLESSTFYPAKAETVKIEAIKYLTSDSGKYFEQEILDYMKYGVWTLDIEPGTVDSVFDGLKESFAAGGLSNSWRGHMKHTVKLEQALENILLSLKKQEEYRTKAADALGNGDGGDFRKNAKSLINEMKKIPSLVEKYKACADKLKQELVRTRLEMEGKSQDLNTSSKAAFEEEMAAYESYVEADGERMREVEKMADQVPGTIALIEAVMEEAESVEDYIDSWEPEEEDDDLDEDTLWEPVKNRFNRISFPAISCKMGVKDKESQGLLEKVENLINLDLLSLVIPADREVSKKVISLVENPSAGIQTDNTGTGGESSLVDRIFMGEYGMKVFPYFLSEESGGYYEAEYVIGGKNTDRDNLDAVVKDLLLLREGANLAFLLTNSQKRGEAQALAASIVGVTGIAPLVMALTFFILGIWALGESMMDIKQLLNGGKVPLFKTPESWNISIQGLLDMGKKGEVMLSESSDSGFTYSGYLKLLFLIQDPVIKRFRMMDMIQMNVRQKEAGFRISECVYSLEAAGMFQGKHIFLSNPLFAQTSYTGSHTYGIRISTEKSY